MEPDRVDAGTGSQQTPRREEYLDHLQASRQWIREQRRGLPLPRSMPGALRGVTHPRMRTSRTTYARKQVRSRRAEMNKASRMSPRFHIAFKQQSAGSER